MPSLGRGPPHRWGSRMGTHLCWRLAKKARPRLLPEQELEEGPGLIGAVGNTSTWHSSQPEAEPMQAALFLLPWLFNSTAFTSRHRQQETHLGLLHGKPGRRIPEGQGTTSMGSPMPCQAGMWEEQRWVDVGIHG